MCALGTKKEILHDGHLSLYRRKPALPTARELRCQSFVFWREVFVLLMLVNLQQYAKTKISVCFRYVRLTPFTQSNFFPKLICFFYGETHKFSTYIQGVFQFLLHRIFLEQVHSARSSCTADAWPLNGFENGPNLAENKIEYVLLTTSLGIRNKYIRIGNKFDCVEGVTCDVSNFIQIRFQTDALCSFVYVI